MSKLITRRGYSILSSLFVFISISIIAREFIFLTISMFIFSIFLVELLIFLFSIRELSSLKIIRDVSKSRLFLGDTLFSSIVIQNDGRRTIGLVKLSKDIPEEFHSLIKNQPYAINLVPGDKKEIKYELEARQMGRINLGKLELNIFDKFGLFYKTRVIDTENYVSILPDIRMARGIIDSSIQLGSLSSTTKIDPLGSDYAGIREYNPGDDYRRISWKQMAKSSRQEPRIKQFDLDQRIDVNLVIVNSGSMNDGSIGERKLDSVVQAAITISSVVDNAGGSFKVIFSENGMPKTISGNQYELCNNLYRIKSESQMNQRTLINHAITYGDSSSIFLFILDSPFPEKIETDDFRNLYNRSLVSLFLLDTTSYIPEEIIKKSQGDTTELFQNERNHLQKQLEIMKQKKFRAELCTKDNITKNILDSFSRIQILIE